MEDGNDDRKTGVEEIGQVCQGRSVHGIQLDSAGVASSIGEHFCKDHGCLAEYTDWILLKIFMDRRGSDDR